MTFEETVAKGFEPATVKRVEQLLYVSEYKRRQAPPGVKISPRNFGRDRRYPITNAFRDAHDDGNVDRPLRPVAHRLSACRQCPRRRCSISCSRSKTGGKFLLRIDDTDDDALQAGIRSRDPRGSGLARPRRTICSRASPTAPTRISAAAEKLKAAGRLYPCYETAAELDRRRKRQMAARQAAGL